MSTAEARNFAMARRGRPFTNAARGRLREMFVTHREIIRRTLRLHGVESDAAADLTQQAFLIAAERLDDIRPGCERAFLMETGLRLARAAWRRMLRMQFEDDMDQHMTSAARVDEALDQRRAEARIEVVLASLSPELLRVFLLFEMEDVSTREIARLEGIPVGTAASRLRRARKVLHAERSRMERPGRTQARDSSSPHPEKKSGARLS